MIIKFTRAITLFKKNEYKLFKIDNNTDFNESLKTSNFKKRFIFSFHEFKQLYIYDFSNFNVNFINALLKKNCIAFIIYNKNKLVHLTWLSIKLNTHKLVDDISFKKYTSENIFGVWGNSFTHPEFRGLGFNKVAISQCIKYLKEKHIKYSFASVRSNNHNNIKTYNKIKKCYIYHTMIIKFLCFRIIF
jgi:ribosomal protein S18 acetylase RimI-like enzyme